jgi:hypothetical protein
MHGECNTSPLCVILEIILSAGTILLSQIRYILRKPELSVMKLEENILTLTFNRWHGVPSPLRQCSKSPYRKETNRFAESVPSLGTCGNTFFFCETAAMALLPFLTINHTDSSVARTTSRDTSHLPIITKRRVKSSTSKEVRDPFPFDPSPTQIEPKLKGIGLLPHRGVHARGNIARPAHRNPVVESSTAVARAPGASKQLDSTPAVVIKREGSPVSSTRFVANLHVRPLDYMLACTERRGTQTGRS